MTSYPIEKVTDPLPASLLVNIYRHASIPRCLFFLHIAQLQVPYVAKETRYSVKDLGRSVIVIIAKFGFMELPNLERIIDDIKPNIDLDLSHTTLEVGTEEIILEDRLPLMTGLRLKLFKSMMLVSVPAHRHFGIPADVAEHLSKTVIPVRFGTNDTSVRLPNLDMNIHLDSDAHLLNSAT